MQQKSRGSSDDKGVKRSTQEKSGLASEPPTSASAPPKSSSSKRKSVTPGVSFGYNSPFPDDEHIVRHSLSSVEGMPVLNAEEIAEQAAALHEQRVKSGVSEHFERPFSETPAELEREARLEADVEANEEST
jgi:hypothetical protein